MEPPLGGGGTPAIGLLDIDIGAVDKVPPLTSLMLDGAVDMVDMGVESVMVEVPVAEGDIMLLHPMDESH